MRRYLIEVLALLACAIVGALILAPVVYGADWHVETGWGKCRASAPDDGTWQQREQPHRIQLSDQCGEIGLRRDLANNAWLGVRYVNFGQFAVQARANNDPGDLADRRGTISADHTRPECATPNAGDSPLKEDCHYLWNGSGRLTGFLVNAGAQPLEFRGLKVGPEAGVILYRATWRMVIQPIADPSAWQYQVDQRTGWRLAPELGLRADWKWVYTAVRWYWIPDGAPITPAYRSPIRQFVVGASIPFSF